VKAKIISLGTAFPPYYFTQRDAYEALGYKSDRTRQLFQNAQIEGRYVWIEPYNLERLTFDSLCREYNNGALVLGKKAIKQCLDDRDPKSIGSLTYASTTQARLNCPSLSYLIAPEVGLSSNIEHNDLIGGGCQGSSPAIRRAYDHYLSSGKPALALSCEICTATFFPAPEHDLENTVANAIFGDGASACLIGDDADPRHPYLVDFESEFDPQYKDYLGYKWVPDGTTTGAERIKVVLHKDVPKIAPILTGRVMTRLLRRNNLMINDIQHLIIHPGGTKVLDNIRDVLNIPEEKMTYSREILLKFGNMSSATIGAIGKLVRQVAKPGDWGLVVSMGAGFSVYSILLKWEEK
jgi:predicted naringenin-chalcone synthase